MAPQARPVDPPADNPVGHSPFDGAAFTPESVEQELMRQFGPPSAGILEVDLAVKQGIGNILGAAGQAIDSLDRQVKLYLGNTHANATIANLQVERAIKDKVATGLVKAAETASYGMGVPVHVGGFISGKPLPVAMAAHLGSEYPGPTDTGPGMLLGQGGASGPGYPRTDGPVGSGPVYLPPGSHAVQFGTAPNGLTTVDSINSKGPSVLGPLPQQGGGCSDTLSDYCKEMAGQYGTPTCTDFPQFGSTPNATDVCGNTCPPGSISSQTGICAKIGRAHV